MNNSNLKNHESLFFLLAKEKKNHELINTYLSLRRRCI